MSKKYAGITGADKRNARKAFADREKGNSCGGVVFVSIFMAIVCVVVAMQSSKIEPVTFKMSAVKPLKVAIKPLKVASILGSDQAGPSGLAFGQARLKQELPEEKDEATPATPPADDDDVIIEEEKMRDVLFSSVANGSVVQIDIATGEVEEVVVTGNPQRLRKDYSCGTYYTESICGRPTGISMDQDGLRMYVIDSYEGLLLVDPIDKKKEVLVYEIEKQEGFHYLTDLVVSRHTGRVYFLEASVTHRRRDYVRAHYEAASTGRLLMYNPEMATIEVIAGKLVCPTSLTIVEGKDGKSDDYILIAEGPRARVRQYFLPTKTREGTMSKSTFVSNLPVLPHSIQYDPSTDALWVGGDMRREQLDQFSRWPKARKVMSLVPVWIMDLVMPKQAALLRLDPRKGNTREVFADEDGVLTGAMKFHVQGDHVYIASERGAFDGIAKVPLK